LYDNVADQASRHTEVSRYQPRVPA